MCRYQYKTALYSTRFVFLYFIAVIDLDIVCVIDLSSKVSGSKIFHI